MAAPAAMHRPGSLAASSLTSLPLVLSIQELPLMVKSQYRIA